MMYIAAAEMEVCNANYEGMEVLVKSILLNGRSFDDKIQAKTLQIYAFGVTDRQQTALDLGRELLSDLGFPLSRRFCSGALRKELKSVRKLWKGKSNEYIGRLPMIEDKNILAALHVLNLVRYHLFSADMGSSYVGESLSHTSCYALCNTDVSPRAFGSANNVTICHFEIDDVNADAWTQFSGTADIWNVWHVMYSNGGS
jgi:predicted ATPase